MEYKRVYVPLDPETLAAVEALAEARGSSSARVCSEVLQETGPILREMAKALVLAKSAPARAMREMQTVLADQIAKADQFSLDLDAKPKRRKRRRAA